MEKGKPDNWKKTMRISDIGVIELSGMEFHAYHGCFEKERAEGNLFVVDFKAEYHFKTAARSDRLEDTVDYADVYKVIREEMDKPANLMENVAWRMVKGIAEKFPQFIRFQVTLSKHNPPVGGACQWSRVTVSYPQESKADRIKSRRW